MDTAKLRAEGASLKASIKVASERLKEIETELQKDGPQKYEECTVVGESTQVIVPEGDDDEQVKKFAGEHYGKLFEQLVAQVFHCPLDQAGSVQHLLDDLAQGQPVRLVVTRTVERTCATDIVVSEFGIKKPLPRL